MRLFSTLSVCKWKDHKRQIGRYLKNARNLLPHCIEMVNPMNDSPLARSLRSSCDLKSVLLLIYGRECTPKEVNGERHPSGELAHFHAPTS